MNRDQQKLSHIPTSKFSQIMFEGESAQVTLSAYFPNNF